MPTPDRQRQRRENEIETYKRAIDASSIVGITDPDGVIRYVNDNFCRISKYSSSELIGRTHQIINSGYHSKEFFKEMWATISSGTIWKGEIRNKAKDGTIYWVDTTIVPFMDPDGRPERYVSIRSDITDRKLAKNNKFQMFFDNSHEGLLMARPDGTFLEVNNAFCRMLGYEREEFLKLNRQQITLNDDPGINEALRIRSETGYFKGAIKFRRKDGTIIDGEISTAIYTDENGERKSYVQATDITEKLKIENALRSGEHRLQSMMEYSNDIITLINADRSMRYRSPSYRRILGYASDDMEDRVVFEQIHPDDLPDLKELFIKLMAAPGSNFKSQWRQKHKDGTYRWMEGTGTNLLRDPHVNAVICNFRDITEHIEIEQQLEKSNQELTHLFNSIDEVAFSANIDPYYISHISDACQKVYGYPASSFLSNEYFWVEVIIAEDKHKIDCISARLQRGELVSEQYRIRHANGGIRWIETNVTPTLDDDGKLIRFDGLNRDITEKKRTEEALLNSEKRYRALIENSKDGIAIANSNWELIYLSPSIKDILGYEPQELNSSLAFELLHPDELMEHGALLTSITEGKTLYASRLLRVRHKDGSWRWIEATVANQMDDPAVNALVTNFRDVTARKNAEEKLEHLNESLEKKVKERTLQLEESNKALESFSSLAAHDLQSPLRVLSGYANLLKQEYGENLGEDGGMLLEAIMVQTRQMTSLVSDLLTFSRASHTILKEEKVNIDAMVRDLSDHLCLVCSGMTTAQIRIYDLGCGSCDAGLMRQVWSNLISNALKYSSKREKPQVEIGRIAKDGESIFYVKDNGTGFDMALAPRLFQIFQRLHAIGDFEGTGLGLALVKNIVSRHGGRVWVEAEVDKGATFFFSLPD